MARLRKSKKSRLYSLNAAHSVLPHLPHVTKSVLNEALINYDVSRDYFHEFSEDRLTIEDNTPYPRTYIDEFGDVVIANAAPAMDTVNGEMWMRVCGDITDIGFNTDLSSWSVPEGISISTEDGWFRVDVTQDKKLAVKRSEPVQQTEFVVSLTLKRGVGGDNLLNLLIRDDTAAKNIAGINVNPEKGYFSVVTGTPKAFIWKNNDESSTVFICVQNWVPGNKLAVYTGLSGGQVYAGDHVFLKNLYINAGSLPTPKVMPGTTDGSSSGTRNFSTGYFQGSTPSMTAFATGAVFTHVLAIPAGTVIGLLCVDAGTESLLYLQKEDGEYFTLHSFDGTNKASLKFPLTDKQEFTAVVQAQEGKFRVGVFVKDLFSEISWGEWATFSGKYKDALPKIVLGRSEKVCLHMRKVHIFDFAVPDAKISEVIPGVRTRVNSSLDVFNDVREGTYTLPYVGGWNTGPNGYLPAVQEQLLQDGIDVIMPWFAFTDPSQNENLAGSENMVEYARAKKIPLTFKSTQFEQSLYQIPKYKNLPPEENPREIKLDGSLGERLCPFAPVKWWAELGDLWIANRPQLEAIQEKYPDLPYVLFVSNNEAKLGRWYEAEQSKRFVDLYGLGTPDDFKRKVYGEGFRVRFDAFFAAFRKGLKQWKGKARFVGYNAVMNGRMYTNDSWLYGNYSSNHSFIPLVNSWDGASISTYVDDWALSTDYYAYGPHSYSCNLHSILNWVREHNPNYFIEMSVWDGRRPGGEHDRWAFYQAQGQTYTPERYAAYVLFCMYLLRPASVREFRLHPENYQDTIDYFKKVIVGIQELHDSDVLSKFYLEGKLVVNTAREHPFSDKVWHQFDGKDRWFWLDVDVNPSYPWDKTTEINVFAGALMLGEIPNRQWLIFASAPLKTYPQVSITIPGYSVVSVPIEKPFSMWVISEKTRRVSEVSAW